MESKKWYLSKTLWFNLIVGVLQTADMAGGTGIIPQPYGIVVQSVANLVLRYLTKQPVVL